MFSRSVDKYLQRVQSSHPITLLNLFRHQSSMFVRYTLWHTLVGLLSRLILIEFFKNPIPEIPKTRWSLFSSLFALDQNFFKKESPPLPSIFRKSLFSKNPIVFRSLQLPLHRRRAHACTLGTRVSLSNGASNELLHTHTHIQNYSKIEILEHKKSPLRNRGRGL